jgi:tetratricopeptide (TPR) repeat protein
LETVLDAQAKTFATMKDLPAVRAKVFRSLGRIRAENTNDIDGAIAAYESVLDAEPEVTDVRELAGLYVLRGKEGDAARAADLYFTVGDITEGTDQISILEKALDLVPTHDGALTLLEKIIPQEEQGKRLHPHWAAYVEKAPTGPNGDARRLLLAQAYGEQGRYQEALAYIAELVRKRDEAANKLHVDLSAKMSLAEKARSSGSPRGSTSSVPSAPKVPSSSPHVTSSSPVTKKTLVGYKLSEVSDNAPPPAGAVQIPESPDPPGASDWRNSPLPPRPSQNATAVRREHDTISLDERSLEEVLHGVDEEEAAYPRKKLPVKWLAAGAAVVAIGAGLALWPRAKEANKTPSVSSTVTAAGGPNAPSVTAPIPTTQAAPAGQAGSKGPTLAVENKDEAAVTAKTKGQIETEQGAKSDTSAQATGQSDSAAPKKTIKNAAAGVNVKLAVDGASYKGGKIDKKQVLKALEEKMPEFERCYSKALKKTPQLKGRLVYSWTVKKNGKVGSVQKLRSTIADANMNKCAMATIRKIAYPKPKNQVAKVQMAWVFSRGE